MNGTVTKTLVTDSAVLGQAQSAQITGGTATFYQQISVDGKNVSVGDRLKFAGVAKVTGAAGSLNFDIKFDFVGATYTVKPLGQTVSTDLPWFSFECEGVVPAGCTVVRPGWATYAGTGTIFTAQFQVVNMTTLGT
jgi:hypothetical protein